MRRLKYDGTTVTYYKKKGTLCTQRKEDTEEEMERLLRGVGGHMGSLMTTAMGGRGSGKEAMTTTEEKTIRAEE